MPSLFCSDDQRLVEDPRGNGSPAITSSGAGLTVVHACEARAETLSMMTLLPHHTLKCRQLLHYKRPDRRIKLTRQYNFSNRHSHLQCHTALTAMACLHGRKHHRSLFAAKGASRGLTPALRACPSGGGSPGRTKEVDELMITTACAGCLVFVCCKMELLPTVLAANV
ncbi:hypothetical protein T440DRAFT_472262 [Plenodomus tracheiphilus IPT5]|uniref:Uncharacterized protein n=1 Tax=Plenodomus tracheiphilus IPT5 TaxID=1408161 RepID=A0A6A7ASB5_9PLEO|nr:hypothetical protein T440DRAFT_472262 [Plenodomus tracheiphilus IPT5]